MSEKILWIIKNTVIPFVGGLGIGLAILLAVAAWIDHEEAKEDMIAMAQMQELPYDWRAPNAKDQ